jgi:hypothetical protein
MGQKLSLSRLAATQRQTVSADTQIGQLTCNVMLLQPPNNQHTTVIHRCLHTNEVLLKTQKIPFIKPKYLAGIRNPATAFLRPEGFTRRPPLCRGGVSLWPASLASGNFWNCRIFSGETAGM